jgi:hypothetical protein
MCCAAPSKRNAELEAITLAKLTELEEERLRLSNILIYWSRPAVQNSQHLPEKKAPS